MVASLPSRRKEIISDEALSFLTAIEACRLQEANPRTQYGVNVSILGISWRRVTLLFAIDIDVVHAELRLKRSAFDTWPLNVDSTIASITRRVARNHIGHHIEAGKYGIRPSHRPDTATGRLFSLMKLYRVASGRPHFRFYRKVCVIICFIRSQMNIGLEAVVRLRFHCDTLRLYQAFVHLLIGEMMKPAFLIDDAGGYFITKS